MAGKRLLGKVANRLCRYLVDQKFRRNRSISLRFQSKRVFAFYTEIQDGCQKWWENIVLQKVASRRNHSIMIRFRDKHLLRFMQKFKMAIKSGGKTFVKHRQ